jgi:hypothetical protein
MTGWVAASWVVTVGSIVVVSATIAGIWLRRRRNREADDFGESSGFSISRYQPMEHLLSEEDFAFLASQPGYEPKIGVRWKRERRRIFRLYLDDLKRDFRRLHIQARVMAANADAESAELVGILMRQQVMFWRAMVGLELRLALRTAGIGKVDIRPLIELIEAMRVNLARFSEPRTA